MRRSALEATAFHEAGHAVAAVLKGLRFEYVTIEADAICGSAGHMKGRFRKPKTLEHFYTDGVVAMAGEAAQRRFRPGSIRRHHGGGDREVAVDLALRAGCDAPQAELLVRLWELQALSLVDLRWPQIQRVATALLEMRRLAMEQVRQLAMERASP